MKKFYITITALFLGFTLLNAQTITVFPSDDMTTNTGSSGMFPSDEQLWVANWAGMQNFQQTLLKFDLSNYNGQSITSAKLKIYQHFHAPDGTPTPSKIYAITENWNETTWPTSSNVSHGTTEYAAPNFTSILDWYEIDITDLVNAWLNADLENNGLVIIANSGTKFAEFYSKDASDQSKHPFLEIEGTTGINIISNYVDNISVFPNPICRRATVDFNLLSSQKVNISIVNILGNKVQQVCNKQFAVGKNLESFSCDNLETGIYFLRLQTNSVILNRKIIIK
jgi:hypothetical protein